MGSLASTYMDLGYTTHVANTYCGVWWTKYFTLIKFALLRSFLCTASAAALEPKVREQVRLTLGGGQTRLHVREAQLLAGADGPQRTDHEAAWTLSKGVELATM